MGTQIGIIHRHTDTNRHRHRHRQRHRHRHRQTQIHMHLYKKESSTQAGAFYFPEYCRLKGATVLEKACIGWPWRGCCSVEPGFAYLIKYDLWKAMTF